MAFVPNLRTELHRHLDASLRPATLAELLLKYDANSQIKTAEDVKSRFWLTHQMNSLDEVLSRFSLFQKALGSVDALERVARETVEDVGNEGTNRIELRYSPSFTSEVSAISWEDALLAIDRGLKAGMQASNVQAGLICIISRGYGLDLAMRTAEFACTHRDKFVGVDLAGPEQGFPCRDYKKAFDLVRGASLKVTIHAGEACGPENVWEAIDVLGASRIGHGIRSVKDPKLIKRLQTDGILLELCPTSNFITRSVNDWKDHPLPRLLQAGVPISINTDDPGIFGIPLDEEYSRCRHHFGLSDSDFSRIDEYAFRHSFLK